MDQQISSEKSSAEENALNDAGIFCGLSVLVGLVIFVHLLMHFRS